MKQSAIQPISLPADALSPYPVATTPSLHGSRVRPVPARSYPSVPFLTNLLSCTLRESAPSRILRISPALDAPGLAQAPLSGMCLRIWPSQPTRGIYRMESAQDA